METENTVNKTDAIQTWFHANEDAIKMAPVLYALDDQDADVLRLLAEFDALSQISGRDEASLAKLRQHILAVTPEEPSGEGDEDKLDAEAAKPDEEKRIFIMVTMQQDQALFDFIDADAKANSIGRAAMARQILAKFYNYTLNESATKAHKKYATEEEKVEARKKAAKTRNEEIKLMREQHKAKQELRALKAAGKAGTVEATALEARIEAIETELLS